MKFLAIIENQAWLDQITIIPESKVSKVEDTNDTSGAATSPESATEATEEPATQQIVEVESQGIAYPSQSHDDSEQEPSTAVNPVAEHRVIKETPQETPFKPPSVAPQENKPTSQPNARIDDRTEVFYIWLASQSQPVTMSYKKMATTLGWSQSEVKQIIGELVNANRVERVQNRRIRSNSYFIPGMPLTEIPPPQEDLTKIGSKAVGGGTEATDLRSSAQAVSEPCVEEQPTDDNPASQGETPKYHRSPISDVERMIDSWHARSAIRPTPSVYHRSEELKKKRTTETPRHGEEREEEKGIGEVPKPELEKPYRQAQQHETAYEKWNRAIADYFVSGLTTGETVYLSVDEDALTDIGDRFFGAEDSESTDWVEMFLRVVRAECVKAGSIDLEPISGYQPSNHPRCVAFLGTMVLAAHRMTEDEDTAEINYFTRLRQPLKLGDNTGRPSGLLPAGVEEPLWANWNRRVIGQGWIPSAQRGESTTYKYINYPLSQALLRQGDKERLERIFRATEAAGQLQQNWGPDQLGAWLRRNATARSRPPLLT